MIVLNNPNNNDQISLILDSTTISIRSLCDYCHYYLEATYEGDDACLLNDDDLYDLCDKGCYLSILMI